MDREPPLRWLPPTPATDPATPPSPPPARRTGVRRWLYPLAGAGALALNFAGKAKALLLVLPKLKLLSTGGTMLLSVAAYALLWGWRFAVGFVALLFVHEMGHYIQMRREGVRPGGVLFIPLLRAALGAPPLRGGPPGRGGGGPPRPGRRP